ncbi:radical SAM protein [Ochrovirga pacifica]|uniref:radical SAM protein n=1 Tax=Ochrovirga pacifica TaxID=1042376 RepID=UPI000255A7C9|nr:radical SAM protein [Ochrovirga pacifica]
MNYYALLKLNNFVKNPRLKFLGLWMYHITGKRYLSLQFDPVNACNLRCKMCYFTDKDYIKKLKGVFPKEDLPLLGKALFRRAAKLQVGCGTEPTLYKNLDLIFKQAQEANIPYVSMTTNANLLEKDTLEQWIVLGLNEITVSLHGVHKATYENFMGKGDYHRFVTALTHASELKKKYPDFKIRINYTFNEDNFAELNDFWEVFDAISIDYLQIRPIDRIGNTAYQNFSLEKIQPIYEKTYQKLKETAQKKQTILIAPKSIRFQHQQSINSVIQPFTYCYISPTSFWDAKFDWKKETFNQYAKRTKLAQRLFQLIFAKKQTLIAMQNKTLNYDIN